LIKLNHNSGVNLSKKINPSPNERDSGRGFERITGLEPVTPPLVNRVLYTVCSRLSGKNSSIYFLLFQSLIEISFCLAATRLSQGMNALRITGRKFLVALHFPKLCSLNLHSRLLVLPT